VTPRKSHSTIRSSDFTLAAVQAVIFTPDVAEFTVPTLLSRVLPVYATKFDGEIQAIPLPSDAPLEIPRVVLGSMNEEWKLSATPARTDCLWSRKAEEESGVDAVQECVDILVDYVKGGDIRVGRLALVLTRVHEVANAPQLLVQRFCNTASQKEPFNRSSNFEIHNHKVYQFPRTMLNVNSWVRCKSITAEVLKTGFVVVEQDLNTLTEAANETTFDAEMARDFFLEAMQEANSILELYFPKEAK